ncbi:MAG: hypothetical protein PHG67_00780 [Bacteroidales bacterium]|jgi:hypothetical protein|nr:hypothetical protein [Bacteroidales bacterium]HOI31128.1 hypothetical protein [Bacteroidales bacterium]
MLYQIDSLQMILKEQNNKLNQMIRLDTDSLISVLSDYQLHDSKTDAYATARSESIENAKNVLQSFELIQQDLLTEIQSQYDQLDQVYQLVRQHPADSLKHQKMIETQKVLTEELYHKNSYYLNRINAQLLLIEQLTNQHKAKN